MATIVTRETTQTDGTSPKGSPLTNAEVDTNFINLNDNKVEVSGAIIFQAKAGEALAKGDVVYVSGVSGNEPIVSKADADDANKMPAYGLAEDAANLNAAVNIVTFGTLYELDTSGFSAGDIVYVSTTAGSLTATKPTGESSLVQNVGTVIRSHASVGSIKVGGAGRTNDTPNLNDGNVFIGNASNQAVARALTGDDISGGTITSFASTGIDDNATSTAITIDSSDRVGIGITPINANLEVAGTGTTSEDVIHWSNSSGVNKGMLQLSSTGGGQLQLRDAGNTVDVQISSTTDSYFNGGNVGIGTTSPAELLHVNEASTNAARMRLSNTDGYIEFGTNNQVSNIDSQTHTFRNEAGTTEYMRIDNSGNLQIGSNTADGRLKISAASGSAVAAELTLWGNNGSGFGATNIAKSKIDSVTDGTAYGSNMRFYTNDTSNNYQERMRIDSSGDVKLVTANDTAGTTKKLQFGSTAYNRAEIRCTNAATYDGSLEFYTGNATNYLERMRVNSSGRVGIGETNPDGLLHLTGDTNANGAELFLQVNNNNTTDNLGAIHFGNNVDSTLSRILSGTSGTSTSSYLTFATSSSGTISEAMRIDSSGDSTFYGQITQATAGVGLNASVHTGMGIKGSTPRFTMEPTADGQSSRIQFANTAGTMWGSIFAYNDSERIQIQADKVNFNANEVGIGTTNPSTALHVSSATTTKSVVETTGTSSDALIEFTRGQGSGNSWSIGLDQSASSALSFAYLANGSPSLTTHSKMVIDSSGNLLVGKDVNNTFNEGFVAKAAGGANITSAGDTALELNRRTSDGTILNFRKDNTAVGSIGVTSSDLYIQGPTDHAGLRFDTAALLPLRNGTITGADNLLDIGAASYRFDDIYATNGTIQTSDANEKQDIEALSEAETRVAVAAKALLRKFRWKSAVEEKGDEARIHFGIIAQDLKAAFEAEGLDAGRYAMFIHSTWTDEETGEERSRMGVRYSELLAFIIAAI